MPATWTFRLAKGITKSMSYVTRPAVVHTSVVKKGPPGIVPHSPGESQRKNGA
jgi:hypothetical protein